MIDLSNKNIKEYFDSLSDENTERSLLKLIFMINEIKIYLDEILTRLSELEKSNTLNESSKNVTSDDFVKTKIDEKINKGKVKPGFFNYLKKIFKNHFRLSLEELVKNYEQKLNFFILNLEETNYFYHFESFEFNEIYFHNVFEFSKGVQILKKIQQIQITLKNLHKSCFKDSKIYL